MIKQKKNCKICGETFYIVSSGGFGEMDEHCTACYRKHFVKKMVQITEEEYEELKEKAWMYDDLNK